MTAADEPATRYLVTHPDGSVSFRNSRARQYSHAVQALRVTPGNWDVLQWCETWDAASKAAARLQSKYVLGRVWKHVAVVRVKAEHVA